MCDVSARMREYDLRFGMELEVSANAKALAVALEREGLASMDYLHDYHCSCDDCDYGRNDGTLWACQEDSSVAGEFISVPMWIDSEDAHIAFDGIARAMLGARVRVGNGYDTSTGGHVHVTSHWLMVDNRMAWRQLIKSVAKFADELQQVASVRKRMRSYNGSDFSPNFRLSRWNGAEERSFYGFDRWLVDKGETVEFRLWGSTTSAWRMRLHAGLSLGLALAAIEEAPIGAFDDGQTLVEYVSAYLPEDVPELLARQLEYQTTL